MSYRIAYGMDTESLEDPEQIALVTMPDSTGAAEMDNDELTWFIGDNWHDDTVLHHQPMVGFDDTMDVVRALLILHKGGTLDLEVIQSIIEQVTASVLDAYSNA